MSAPLRYSVPVESDYRLYRTHRHLLWLGVAVLCMLLFVADLIGVENGVLAHADRSLDLSLHHTFGRSTDSVFADISTIGGDGVRAAVVAIAAIVLLVRRRWISALLMIIVVGGAALVDTGIKALVGRPRPHFFHHAVSAAGSSFPSGHATGAAALALVLVYLLWHLTRRRALTLTCLGVAIVFTILVGLSRLVLGVHYPSDVAGGFALGGACVGLSLAFFAPLVAQENMRRSLP